MAHNQYMHPRNMYKDNPPDFRRMAINYPEFRKHCRMDAVGKVDFDFKNPEAVSVLTKTLLQQDFNLTVEIPPDSLVPRLPARLNYMLWVQDLVADNFKDATVRCIDIGTGASCIYPLLGVRLAGWEFTAIEALPSNADCARRNVHANGLDEKIEVVNVTKEQSLSEVVGSTNRESFHVWMCNPPFFEMHELDGSRTVIPRDPHSATVGKPEELRTEGGEVQFVARLIDESVKLGTKVRIYTSLLGRKSSLRPVLSKLQDCGAKRMCRTMFGQGRTLRWAVAWTFDDAVLLKDQLKVEKKKPKDSTYNCILTDSSLHPCTLVHARDWIEGVMNDCKVSFSVTVNEPSCVTYEARASRNTWVGSRQRRRAAELMQESPAKVRRIDDKPIVPELHLEIVVQLSESGQLHVYFKFVSGPSADLVHQLKQHCLNMLKQRNSLDESVRVGTPQLSA